MLGVGLLRLRHQVDVAIGEDDGPCGHERGSGEKDKERHLRDRPTDKQLGSRNGQIALSDSATASYPLRERSQAPAQVAANRHRTSSRGDRRRSTRAGSSMTQ